MGASSLLSIPCPSFSNIGVELAIQHLNNILSNDRQELPTMERSSGGNEEVLAARMIRNDEILIRGNAIPDLCQKRNHLQILKLTNRFGTNQIHIPKVLFQEYLLLLCGIHPAGSSESNAGFDRASQEVPISFVLTLHPGMCL